VSFGSARTEDVLAKVFRAARAASSAACTSLSGFSSPLISDRIGSDTSTYLAEENNVAAAEWFLAPVSLQNWQTGKSADEVQTLAERSVRSFSASLAPWSGLGFFAFAVLAPFVGEAPLPPQCLL